MQIDRESILELARASGFQTGCAYMADGSFGYYIAMPVVPGNCFLEIEKLVRIVAQHAAESESRRARQPLTHDEVNEYHGDSSCGFCIEEEHYFKAFRDAERAHGIGGGNE